MGIPKWGVGNNKGEPFMIHFHPVPSTKNCFIDEEC